MKLEKTVPRCLAALVAGFSTLACASAFPTLDAAQDAYLRGDVAGVARSVRETLVQNPPASVRRNALDLLDQAMAESPDAAVTVDWKVPAEIRKLKITQRRVERGGAISYALKVSGNTAKRGVVQQVQLVRHPGQVMLDRKGQVGEWMESVEDNPAEGIYFELDGGPMETPAAEGLYLLNLELSSGVKVDGWVILTDLTSSGSPKVHTPTAEETFTTGNPTFHFEDYRSPEMKAHEHRTGWFAVVRLEPPLYQWDEQWTLYAGDLPRTKLTVGREPDGHGAASLAPGNYRFVATYKEQRRFGDVRLGRQSVTMVPFRIR